MRPTADPSDPTRVDFSSGTGPMRTEPDRPNPTGLISRTRREPEKGAMRRQAPAIRGAIRRREIEHQVFDSALDEPGGSLTGEVWRRRGSAIREQRTFAVSQRANHKRRGRRTRMPGECRAERRGRDQPVALHGRRIAVFRQIDGSGGIDRDHERERNAALQPLGNRDAFVRDMTDAFRMRTVAMRRKRQDFAIAAST